VADNYTPLTLHELFASSGFGLSSVIEWITPSDSHWTGGIQYDVDCTEVAVTMMECVSGAPSPNPTKSATWSQITRGARPFTLYDEVDCSPADGNWWDTGQAAALRGLANSSPTGLERALWNGATNSAPVFPNLTTIGPLYSDATNRILLQPAATIISGTPLDVVEGLGRLEKALGDCYDGWGVIHVPSQLGAAFAARNLCYLRGDRLYTYNGNRVAIGKGYTGTGPGNVTQPTGSMFVYATGPVFGIRGAAKTFDPVQSFDRGVNTLKMIAEQTFLLGWTCCLAGVLVTTGGEQAGEPGTPLQDT
jgi:hypothetical protein